jgi:hypothetical protein
MNAETEPKREQVEASRFTPEVDQHQGDIITAMEGLVDSVVNVGKTVR